MTTILNATGLRAGDLMQREVITVPPATSVRELSELLDHQGISGVPVVDAGGRVVGVVSGSDIVRLAAQHDEPRLWTTATASEADVPDYFTHTRARWGMLRRVEENLLDRFTVEDIMTPAIFSVHEDTSLADLARFMLRTGVHRALVLQGGKLLGIVTATDVLRAVAGEVNA